MIETFEPASFEDAIRTCVIPIDEHLAELRIPVPDRVLRAALLFVEYNIQGIKGDSKDDFIQKSWFQFIFRTIRSWYEERYGAAVKRPEAFLLGACEVAGAFFEIRVPVTLVQAERPGETIWLVFPTDLQPEEKPSTWFVAPPNFDALEPSSRDAALHSAITIGHLLRSIHSDLMTAKRPDDVAVALAAKIQSHLRTAVAHLADHRNPMFGLSAWESHQAVESALKLLSHQITGCYQKIHDLTALFREVPGSLLGHKEEAAVRKMPTHKRVIQMRAGDGAPVGAAEVYELYRTSLDLTAQIVAVMPREIRMRNARFLLKKAPFI